MKSNLEENGNDMDTKKEDIQVLRFHASWCAPCKKMEPIVKNVVEQFDNVELINIDVDYETDIATEYKIRSIPTFVIVKNGTEVNRLIGATSQEKFRAFIEST